MNWLRSIWPISSIIARREWARRDREEIVVATAVYLTEVVDEAGAKTGIIHKHILVFLVDGNGVRYCRVETGAKTSAGRHNALIVDKANWRYHGDLPDYATRVEKKGGANLVVFPGGSAA